MSNELIIRAVDAVESLRGALELWCKRDDQAGSALGIRGAADEASASAASAITELTAIRNLVEREAAAYDRAREHRIDSLLGEILVRPLVAAVGLAAAGTSATSYRCQECSAEFPVDPADPIESHGLYLDHMNEHDDCEDDERDKASEGQA